MPVDVKNIQGARLDQEQLKLAARLVQTLPAADGARVASALGFSADALARMFPLDMLDDAVAKVTGAAGAKTAAVNLDQASTTAIAYAQERYGQDLKHEAKPPTFAIIGADEKSDHFELTLQRTGRAKAVYEARTFWHGLPPTLVTPECDTLRSIKLVVSKASGSVLPV